MTDTVAALLWIGVALAAANLPWVSERVLGLVPMKTREKPEWLRLLEWFFLFLLAAAIGFAFEYRQTAELHPQEWEFYVVVLCLFAVFALPGFIYHHDLRRHLRRRAGRAR